MGVARGVCDIDLINTNEAGRTTLQSCNTPEERGFASAVGSDECGNATGRNGKRDVIERPVTRIVED